MGFGRFVFTQKDTALPQPDYDAAGRAGQFDSVLCSPDVKACQQVTPPLAGCAAIDPTLKIAPRTPIIPVKVPDLNLPGLSYRNWPRSRKSRQLINATSRCIVYAAANAFAS